MSTAPRQSGVRSDDLQIGHTLPIVTPLHFRQAISLTISYHLVSGCFVFSAAPAGGVFGFFTSAVAAAAGFLLFFISSSIHSSAPRKGCLQVIPTFMAAVLPSDTAVILARSVVPIFIVLPLWLAKIMPDLTSLLR